MTSIILFIGLVLALVYVSYTVGRRHGKREVLGAVEYMDGPERRAFYERMLGDAPP